MAITFWPSAAKHRISQERARYVIEHCPYPMYAIAGDEDDVDLLLFLGTDRGGVPLEVVALELANGDLAVIHAMVMRRKLVGTYVEVMRWS